VRDMAELPEARRDRFVSEYGLPLYDANLLTSTKAMADYFEACLKTGKPADLPLTNRAKMASNWLLGEFTRLLNATNWKSVRRKSHRNDSVNCLN
jgi:aspartyl-tRNA(Asn)/glutamyl-tRNA(Gln) amidotransferase subunit B